MPLRIPLPPNPFARSNGCNLTNAAVYSTKRPCDLLDRLRKHVNLKSKAQILSRGLSNRRSVSAPPDIGSVLTWK